MRRPYQITGVVFILLAAFIARESLELRYYTSIGPGPGFFPFWLSIILGGLAALMVYHATVGTPEPLPADFFATRMGYARIAAILAAMGGVAALMEPLGFRLVMLVFYVFLLQALGRQNAIVTALVALAGSWGVHHVFVEFLKVSLPSGVFGI